MKELKEQFEEIRQQVINEMFEGKRPVFKKLTELSTSDLEMKCMEKAYALDRNEWVPMQTDQIFENTANLILLFDTGEICRYNEDEWPRAIVTHYMKLPQPPQS